MTAFVSLNGPDNSGKTTQVHMLAQSWEGLFDLGPVHRHDPLPWARVSGQEFSAWWFSTSTTKELTRMLFAGHTARAQARPLGTVGILDRGWHMLLATAIATCAVKDALPIEDAQARVLPLLSTVEPDPPETPILLLPSTDTDRSLLIAQQRDTRPWTGTYLSYQRHLHRVLLRMANQSVFVDVIAGQHGITATQAHIHRTLTQQGFGIPSDRTQPRTDDIREPSRPLPF